MQLRSEVQHDEINLFRLVRRLEKGVLQSPSVWDVDAESANTSQIKPEELRVKAHKELQKVKYARRLVKSVEGCELGSSERTRRIGAVKIALDRVERVLKDAEARCAGAADARRVGMGVLDQIPVPAEPSSSPSPPSASSSSSTSTSFPSSSSSSPSLDSKNAADNHDEEDEEGDGQRTPRGAPTGLTLGDMDNFLLSPPDEYPRGLPSSGLVSALPALMSAVEPLDAPPPYLPSSSSSSSSSSVQPTARAMDTSKGTSTTTALAPAPSSGGLTTRKPPTDALHTELSTQLELMAAQLKRNALHFSSALEKDKAVVETALGKVEGNLGFMETQRQRLRDFGGKSRGTTWMTLGIVLVVLAVFVVMVGFIRVTRV